METVCLLSREKVDGYVNVDLDANKIVSKSKTGFATYKEIKEYICNGKTWNKDLNNDVLSKFNKKTENNTTFLVGKNWKYDYK